MSAMPRSVIWSGVIVSAILLIEATTTVESASISKIFSHVSVVVDSDGKFFEGNIDADMERCLNERWTSEDDSRGQGIINYLFRLATCVSALSLTRYVIIDISMSYSKFNCSI